MKAHTWKVRDRVVVYDHKPGSRFHGRTGTVLKANPKNVLLELDGGGRLNCYHGFLHPEGTPPPAPVVPVAEAVPYAPFPDCGVTVEYVGTDTRITGLWVVIGYGAGKVRITKHGGWGNRYWRIEPHLLREVKVNVDRVAE